VTTATNNNINSEHIAGVDGSTEPARAEERGAKRLANFVSRHVFGLYLLVASIGMMFLLHYLAVLGEFQYDTALPIAVLFFGIAVMAWPAVLAIRKKQHTVLRLAVAFGSVLFVPMLVMFMLLVSTTNRSYVEQWQVDLVGPVIIPLLSIAFHAAAGFMLAKFKPEGENEIEQLSNELPVLREERDRGNALVASLTADVRAEEEDTPLIAASFEAAETDAKVKFDDREAAKTAADENPTGLNVIEAEKALAMAAEIKDKTERKAAIEEVRKLLDIAIAAHEASDEWADYQSALNSAIVASNLVAEIARDQQSAGDRLRDARNAHSATSRAAELRQIAVVGADAALEEAQKASKSGWRDVTFVPVFLLVVAGLMYPIWFGWVDATNAGTTL